MGLFGFNGGLGLPQGDSDIPGTKTYHWPESKPNTTLTITLEYFDSQEERTRTAINISQHFLQQQQQQQKEPKKSHWTWIKNWQATASRGGSL